MVQELAKKIYNKEEFSPFEIKTLKNQNIKNILSLCIETCDFYCQELKDNFSIEYLTHSIKGANTRKKSVNINQNTLNKLGQTLITKEQEAISEDKLEEKVAFIGNENTAKSYDNFTQKFNDSINHIFKHLQEKEKQAVGVVMFDYLWRKMAVNTFIPEAEKANFPDKEPLLKYQYYTQLYENNLKNKDLPQMVELKLFLGKQIVLDFHNRAQELSNLEFSDINKKNDGYRTTFIDGQSRYYALSGVVEKYMLAPITPEVQKQISFKTDPVGLLFDGLITPEAELKTGLNIK